MQLGSANKEVEPQMRDNGRGCLRFGGVALLVAVGGALGGLIFSERRVMARIGMGEIWLIVVLVGLVGVFTWSQRSSHED